MWRGEYHHWLTGLSRIELEEEVLRLKQNVLQLKQNVLQLKDAVLVVDQRGHPWADFLVARVRCIRFLAREGQTDAQIAASMSMSDVEQVALLRLRGEDSGPEDRHRA